MGTNLRIIFCATSLLFVLYVGLQLFIPSYTAYTPIEVEIPEGASFRQAMEILQKNGLIRDKNIFIIIGRITGSDRRIRAGYYGFLGYMSPYQVFKRFIEGRIIEFDITVNEGDSLREIREKLATKGIVSKEAFDRLSTDMSFMTSLNINAPSLEGYLYPDTYRFPKGAKATNVLKTMVDRLRKEYDDHIRKRMAELGWDENEMLTLASIIEREAVTDKERPIISAVYHNRLRLGMPLQADPTAVYGIKSYREKIYKKDLRRKTSYNTYIIKGLPPGPIASPSIESIRAALWPAELPYLYFVSKNDGTHVFSKTLKEHERAIKSIRQGISLQEAES